MADITSSNHVNALAVELLTTLTQCTPETAERALAGLIASGWTCPSSVNVDADNHLSLNGSGDIQAFTDGACSGNPGPGGWSVVFVRDGAIVGEHSGGAKRSTNNQMELTAIREAVRHAPANASLAIHTDSAVVIGWLAKGFKRNVSEIATLCTEIETLATAKATALSFTKVTGHAGDRFNERADKLAVAAVGKVGG